MFEVLRCCNCGKLKVFDKEMLARQGFECRRCGFNKFQAPGKYRLMERLKMAVWCVQLNRMEGNLESVLDYFKAFGMGLRPVGRTGN